MARRGVRVGSVEKSESRSIASLAEEDPMAFTQVASMLNIDAGDTNFYTQPISMAGANGVHVGLTIVSSGTAGTALLKAWPQITNDLENWADVGGASGGSGAPLFGSSSIGTPVALQGAVGPNSGSSSPYDKAIGSTWLRFALRIGSTGFAKTNVALNINTFSG
jgi:hypothetical protein